MVINLKSLSTATTLLFCISFVGCDPNIHKPSNHPCNFPDVDTENDLRTPWTYKIIDKTTSLNLVDTTQNATIHVDSVILMDENLQAIPRYENYPLYEYRENWLFNNFLPYNGLPMPFDAPEAYLNLTDRTFYLRTSYSDIDTIKIHFQQCLILEVLFNGQDVHKPSNDPYSRSVSLYFKK